MTDVCRGFRLKIGLFALVGIFGVSFAPLAGRAIDMMVPWTATAIGLVLVIVSLTIYTAAAGISIVAVIFVIFSGYLLSCTW